MTITINKTADPLNNSTATLAEGTLSSANIVFRLNATTHPNLTAVVTGLTVSETKDGAPIFENGSVGSIYSVGSFSQTTLKTAASAVQTSLTLAVSAVGNACALGVQTLTYSLTLSSTALSGDGTTVVPVSVSPTTATFTTTVTAVNTPYGGRVCRAEFARLRNLEII
jgi:hypothetical protein